MTLIYKILRTTEWEAAQLAGKLSGSAADLADGYIHFSTQAQLRETAERHFSGENGLILVAVQVARLGNALVWEASRGGALFAHLYAPLRLDQIDWVRPMPVSADGQHNFPPIAGG